MKVLVVGGGGREHAIVWKLSQSPRISKLYCAPGNGGIASLAQCVDIEATDIEGILNFAIEQEIDLTVVAPDDPLAMGLVDKLQGKGLRAFGPTQKAAIIESSKVFSKELMKKYRIPTPEYQSFQKYDDAIAFLDKISFPVVIKADGLALGKGVIIATSREEAEKALADMLLENKFGEAGKRVLIEEFITGPEVSILAFTDGESYIPMVSSQDHKRAYDKDEGPNTGGMGAFSPSPHYTPEVAEYVEKNIIEPSIQAMAEEGRAFQGVLYFGLMLTSSGPKVLEYNARFGDPETQVVLPRLKTDLLEIMEAIIDKKLDEIDIQWDERAAVCVVLASEGYPGSYEKGVPIEIKEENDQTFLFHAGTRKTEQGYVTNGGRVLGITALGNDMEDAVESVYHNIESVYFEGMHYRKDIGKKAVAVEMLKFTPK
ncbi:MAG: phosphoribosylamine--glycine ligase [Clostridiales bacterium]|nr:phosphoribosylamine--glycine ligase [Clostridiales bacterium]